MNQRVVRVGNAVARTAATAAAAPAPLRQARRTVLAREVPAERNTVTSTHMGRTTLSEVHHHESMRATRFAAGEEPAHVTIHHGKTIGQEKFCSVRIDVSVTLPCLPEDVEATQELASRLTSDRMVVEEEFMLGAPAPRRAANRRG